MAPQAQHTPGPWRVTHGLEGDLYVASKHGGYVPIRTPFRTGAFTRGGTDRSAHTDAELDANARLIASAPDLLAACQAALGELTDPNRGPSGPEPTIATVRAALAKARGTDD